MVRFIESNNDIINLGALQSQTALYNQQVLKVVPKHLKPIKQRFKKGISIQPLADNRRHENIINAITILINRFTIQQSRF